MCVFCFSLNCNFCHCKLNFCHEALPFDRVFAHSTCHSLHVCSLILFICFKPKFSQQLDLFWTEWRRHVTNQNFTVCNSESVTETFFLKFKHQKWQISIAKNNKLECKSSEEMTAPKIWCHDAEQHRVCVGCDDWIGCNFSATWTRSWGWFQLPTAQKCSLLLQSAVLASYSLRSVCNATSRLQVTMLHSVGDSTIFACSSGFSNASVLVHCTNWQRTCSNSTVSSGSSCFSCQIRNQHVWKPEWPTARCCWTATKLAIGQTAFAHRKQCANWLIG